MAGRTSARRELRVLLIEDHAVLRRSLVRLLESEADVSAVADGASALAQLARERFNLILVDYRLPDSDGIQLLQRLQLAAPDARRVLISGTPIPDLSALLEAGVAHGFLCKPAPPEAWLALLAPPALRLSVCERTRAIASAHAFRYPWV